MYPGGGTARARPVLTSLPLQVLLYFGGWWGVVFWPCAVALCLYKGAALPYPSGRFGAELAVLLSWALVEPPRLLLASRGNKAERAGPLLLALAVGAPCAGLYAYGIRYQTFVLKADVLLHSVSAGFLAAQTLLGGLSALRFAAAARIG